MKLYSTNNLSRFVSLKEAIFKGLPEDKGLFMPEVIPSLPNSFIENLENYSFQEIAFEISNAIFQGAIPEKALKSLIEEAINFPAPLVKLDKHIGILELFHGPSLAFKDFGARFMARLMSYFNQEDEEELVILVATSGDTGGAVASGFYKTPGIKVVILYPSGKVSDLQEKQLTTLGHNISAIEIKGTFDDCQALVKQAFLDKAINKKIRLSSANSINIARLIPQTFYYFEAFKAAKKENKEVVFCVPSGNFGNLTAGLLAQKMGLPVRNFIAATNVNDVVPEYLDLGIYTPRPSIRTLSNAMDVGDPSNFARMLDLFSDSNQGEGSTWNTMKEVILGYSTDDNATKKAMQEIWNQYNYIIDPHGAVGYLALKTHQKSHPDTFGIILETAHPSKFINEMEDNLGSKVVIPERLARLASNKKVATEMKNNYSSFKEWLLSNY